MDIHHGSRRNFPKGIVIGLLGLILSAPTGFAMKNNFSPPLPNRNIGLSVALLETGSAPTVFSSSIDCASQLDQLRTLGIPAVLVNAGRPFAAVSLQSNDPLAEIFDAAESLEILVMLPREEPNWLSLDSNGLGKLCAAMLGYAEETCARFGTKSAFAGWVIPYEIPDSCLADEAKRARLTEFYSSLVSALQRLDPTHVIAGFGRLSFESETLAVKEQWTGFLEAVHLDILILRGVSETVHPAVNEHLWAVTRAADEQSVRLWATIDTFSKESESTQAATFASLQTQVTFLRKYAEHLVAFPATRYFLPDTADSPSKENTERLYQDYQNWRRQQRTSFSYLTPIMPHIPSEPPSKTIQGSFAQIIGAARYYSDPVYVGRELDHMKAVGIELIIPDSTFLDKAYYPSQIVTGREAEGDAVGTILDEAGKREMQMFLSLPHFDYSWVWTFNSDTDAFVQKVQPVVEELHSLYGNRPAFAGWYMPYELCDAFLGDSSHRKRIAGAFHQMVDICHRLAPGKPVLISPYFTTYLPDETFTTIWEETISQSGVDIVAMQDSVGALNVSGAETFRIQCLPHYISMISGICSRSGVQFWWNIETFRQTHGHPIDQENWAATTADFERVKLQVLYAAQEAVKMIQFDFPHYFSPVYANSSIAQRNRPFYEAYKSWFQSLQTE
ncbi:MAG TPA: DUF4434 domain-containing protein [bacterium]|nr:DUF4434 domain-containing protein [bacterium]HQL64151.1 DUF4434 domain-containing protein [bacterium]